MPRNYNRKTDRKKYSEEHFQEALSRIRSGELGVKLCSRLYSIPGSTLRDHMKGRRGKLGSNKGGGGKGTALSKEEETNLATCLRTMSKWGFGLSRNEVLDIVQEYVKRNNIKTPFKNQRPGEDWWLGFKSRHNLSIKKPEPLEHARRLQGADPFVVYGFYDLLEHEIKSLGIVGRPDLIYNCDETSFPHDPSKTKVVTGTGNLCHRVTAGSGRENTSVLACVNAAGRKLPPLIIFRAKNLWDQWIPRNDEYPNTGYVASPKGWMTAEIFENWFEMRFLSEIGPDRPVLLIFDGHTSHVSPKLVECAIKNNISIIKLPPHTSHILQPLDVSCFKGLKAKWDSLLTTWQRDNIGCRPNKAQFAKLLAKSWNALTEQNIKSGFAATGIYDPTLESELKINNHAIAEATFDPSKLKLYKENKNKETNPENTQNLPAVVSTNSTQGISEKSDVMLANVDAAQTTSSSSIKTGFESLLLEKVNIKKSFTETNQLPRKKIATTASILTSSAISTVANANILRSKENRSSHSNHHSSDSESDLPDFTTVSKKTKKRKMKTFFDEDSDLSVHDSTISNIDASEGEADHADIDNNISVNDFCLVKFATKKQIKYYVGKILSERSGDFEIKFLRCKNKRLGQFRWPDVEEVCVIPESDIERKLPFPQERRGIFTFHVDFENYYVS